MTRDGTDENAHLQGALRLSVVRHGQAAERPGTDLVTIEEPLEIRVGSEVGGTRDRHSVAVTMRTPGKDSELAAGFLVSEGVVRRAQDIWRVEHCRDGEDPASDNVVDVYLAPGVEFDPHRLSREIFTSSACGVCGRASIEAVQGLCSRRPEGSFRLSAPRLMELSVALEGAQTIFSRTGGLHAAALFDPLGNLLELREDVGRHNALDKVVGALLMAGALPAADRLLLVSGRASFELVQKSVLAGIPVLVAVGAPSSLAVELAVEYGMTLIGFLRADRFNVYSGSHRVTAS